jgi:RES domain-containing protein
LTVYRICSAGFPSNDGEGARLYGGRWNHRGVRMVYCARNASLCALEVLANSGSLPRNMVLIKIAIPSSVSMETVELGTLPKGWDGAVPADVTKVIGTEWQLRDDSAVLSVPSAIVPHERNYLLNPDHRDFSRIRFTAPVPFLFDPRLK